MRASPPRPLAFRTSTVIAGPRSPGMGRVCVESPPQLAKTTATATSTENFMTVRPSDELIPERHRRGRQWPAGANQPFDSAARYLAQDGVALDRNTPCQIGAVG